MSGNFPPGTPPHSYSHDLRNISLLLEQKEGKSKPAEILPEHFPTTNTYFPGKRRCQSLIRAGESTSVLFHPYSPLISSKRGKKAEKQL